MVNVSNNIIATLLIAAIAISGFGLVTIANLGRIAVTGGVTGTGAANVTITGAVAIEMVRNFTYFNTSTLNGAQRIISTQDDNYGTFSDGGEGNDTTTVYGTCDGTEPLCAFPFIVRNIGNVNVSINISSADEASTWIRTGAASQVKGKNNEANACGADFSGLAGFGEGTWANLNTSATAETVVCSNLDYRDSPNVDELRIHFKLTIPSDTIGSKQDVVTVGAIQV
jgi:hypothetical protein